MWSALWFLIGSLCVFAVFASPRYRSNAEIEQYFANYTARFGNMARSYSIGESNNGTKLLVMLVSAAGDRLGIPNVKLIANIHGNEPAGREILLEYLEHLGTNYNKDKKITWLLDNTRIHVLPTLNPDGFNIAIEECQGSHGRENQVKINLNRNFPDYFHENQSPVQPETAAVIKWMDNTTFVLSASLHGGAVVANYPFDGEEMQKWQTYLKMFLASSGDDGDILRHNYIDSLPYNTPSLTPDDDVFKHLASSYANSHANMHLGIPCNASKYNFKGGITNGAEWYSVEGGMQDYNYAMCGCMELTLELSCCKYPDEHELPKLWEENREALLQFSMQAHEGVKGIIVDAETKKGMSSVPLRIRGRKIGFKTSKNGEFWRILLPGSYHLEITNTASNKSFSVPFTIVKGSGDFPNPVNITIVLGHNNVSYQMDRNSVKDAASTTTSTSTTVTHRVPKVISNFTTTILPHRSPLVILDRNSSAMSSAGSNLDSYVLNLAVSVLIVYGSII